MRALLTVPLHLALWLLLLLVLPQVWLLGLVHGLLQGLRARVPDAAVAVTKAALADETVQELFAAHEAALREGKRPWH